MLVNEGLQLFPQRRASDVLGRVAFGFQGHPNLTDCRARAGSGETEGALQRGGVVAHNIQHSTKSGLMRIWPVSMRVNKATSERADPIELE